MPTLLTLMLIADGHKRYITPYQVSVPWLLEPNKYECGISCLVFGLGTDPNKLGLDVEQWVIANLPRKFKLRFSELNTILENCSGGGKAIMLKERHGLNILLLLQEQEVCVLTCSPTLCSLTHDWIGWLHRASS